MLASFDGIGLDRVDRLLPRKALDHGWAYPYPGELKSFAVLEDGGVLLAAPTALARLSRDGRLLWQVDTDNTDLRQLRDVPGTPWFCARVGPGSLVKNATLVLLSKADGRPRWSAARVDIEGSGPDGLLVRDEDERTWQVDLDSGGRLREILYAGSENVLADGLLRTDQLGLRCSRSLATGEALGCVDETRPGVPRHNRMGDLALKVSGETLTATKADGTVAWTLGGAWGLLTMLSDRQAAVHLGNAAGPLAVVNDRGELEAWFPGPYVLRVSAGRIWFGPGGTLMVVDL